MQLKYFAIISCDSTLKTTTIDQNLYLSNILNLDSYSEEIFIQLDELDEVDRITHA